MGKCSWGRSPRVPPVTGHRFSEPHGALEVAARAHLGAAVALEMAARRMAVSVRH